MPSKLSREEVLAAAKINGDVLMTEGKAYSGDLEIVLAAVENSVDALLWAAPALREDKRVLLTACAANGRALRYTRGLRADKDVALVAVRQDGDSLQFSSGLRGDKDIVLAACTQNGWALQYASEELRDDDEVVAVAVEQVGLGVLRCASTRLRNSSVASSILKEWARPTKFFLEIPPLADLECALAVNRAMASSAAAASVGGHVGWKMGWKGAFSERPTLCGPLFGVGLLSSCKSKGVSLSQRGVFSAEAEVRSIKLQNNEFWKNFPDKTTGNHF